MAQLFTDFSEYSVGSPPSDWTEGWNTGASYSVVADGLQVTEAGAFVRCAFYWDQVNDLADDDQELYVKLNVGSVGIPFFGVRASGFGSEATRTGYVLLVRNDTNVIDLRKAVSGTETTLDGPDAFTITDNDIIHVRIQIRGTALKAKVWADGVSEPGTWNFEVTDSSITTGANITVGCVGNTTNTYKILALGVGTGTDDAPTSAVDPGTNVTIGNQDVESSSYSLAGGGEDKYLLRKFVLDYETDITSVWAAISESSGANVLVDVAIFADNGSGSPDYASGPLHHTADRGPANTTNTFEEFTFATTPNLAAGTYWIGARGFYNGTGTASIAYATTGTTDGAAHDTSGLDPTPVLEDWDPSIYIEGIQYGVPTASEAARAILIGNTYGGGSTNFVSASSSLLDFDDVQVMNSTYFDWASGNPSRLVIKTAGDYLFEFNGTFQSDGVASTSRNWLYIRVFKNGVEQDVGESACCYIRNNGANQSSLHLSFALTGLAVDDYIEIKITHDGGGIANTITATGNRLSAWYIEDETVFIGKGTETTNSTNLNQTTAYPIKWATEVRKDAGFTHSTVTNPEQITLEANTSYLIFVNIPLSSATARTNVRTGLRLDGTLQSGAFASQGYIRAAENISRSSLHLARYLTTGGSAQVLDVVTIEEGNTGTVTVGSLSATIIIIKIPSTYNVYSARGTQVEGPSDNWNQTTGDYDVLWSTDDEIDTDSYTHSTGTNPNQVTIDEAGSYLLSFNAPFTGPTAQRTGPEIQIHIDDVLETGLRSVCCYIRNTNNTNEGSDIIMGVLEIDSAPVVLKVNTRLGLTSGLVDDYSPASLTLVKLPEVGGSGGTAYTEEVADSLTLADVVDADQSYIRSILDSLTLADTVTRATTRIRSALDSLALQDSATKLLSRVRSISDTLTLTDSVATIKTFVKSIADTLTLSDLVTTVKTRVRSVLDSFALVDNVSTSRQRYRTILDSITLEDSVTSVKTYVRAVLDAIVLSDAVSTIKTFIRSILDTVALQDTVSKATSYFRSIIDSITLQDTAVASRLYQTVVTDSIVLVDSVRKGFGKIVRDSLTLEDSVTKIQSLIRSVTDSIVLSDTFAVARGYVRSIVDSITLSDSVLRGYYRRIIDTLTLSDDVFLARTKHIVDSLSLSDTASKAITRVRSVIDSLSLDDNTSFMRYLRVLDSLTLNDVVAPVKTFTRRILEAVSLSDTVSTDNIFTRLIRESITLSDSVSKNLLTGFRKGAAFLKTAAGKIFTRSKSDSGVLRSKNNDGTVLKSSSDSATLKTNDDAEPGIL